MAEEGRRKLGGVEKRIEPRDSGKLVTVRRARDGEIVTAGRTVVCTEGFFAYDN